MARAIASGILTAAVVLSGCSEERASAERAGADGGGGVVVACLQHLPRVLNPFVSPDQASVDLAPLLFTPLVRYSAEGAADAFAPALASAWEWSADHRTLRLTIRDDLTWHDGRPVTVDDVLWTVEAAADTAYQYWNGDDFATLEAVRATGEDGVELRFSAPYGPGLEPLATLPILPRHILGDIAPDSFARAGYHTEPVGSGPYVFRRRNGQNQLVFERNAAYPAALGDPEVERIVVKEIPEVSSLLVELRTAATDLCLTGPSAAREARSVQALELLPAQPGQVQVMLLDHTSPYFDEAVERRALSAALQRTDIAAIVSPLATPARSFTPVSWPAPPDSMLEPDDAAALADSLLTAAGWVRPGPERTRRNGSGEPMAFSIVGPQGYEQVLTVLQAQLARVGIEAEPRVVEGSAFIDIIQDPERRPPVMVLALAPSRIHAPDPRSSLHSRGGTNVGAYSNPVADSLIEALENASGDAEREALYRRLQRLVAGDVPVVYLTHLPDVVIHGARVEGVATGPAGLFASAPDWRVGPRAD